MGMFLRRLFEALVRLYYPVIEVEGRERLPPGPVMFTPNHPNGLLDPLVLRLGVGRPVRFLAKSTLFGNPISRAVMESFGSMPVHRAKESAAPSGKADPSRNEETFARCRAALGAGDAIALFPEGTSHSDPSLKPLKTGAARIALSAETQHDGKLGLSIVPIGLLYERKARFRSRVLVVVGQPRGVADLLDDYHKDGRATVDRLTADLRQALDALVVQAESRDLLEGVARLASWTASGPEGGADLGERHARAQRLLAAHARLSPRDPGRVEAIAREVRDYARILRHLGVRDPWALEAPRVTPRRVLRAAVRLVATAPVAALGAVMGWVPYRLSGIVARRVAWEPDVLGTTKMLAGAALCLVFWIAEAMATGALAGWRWAPLAFAIAPASGYIALLYGERLDEMREAARHLWMRGRKAQMTERLLARRRALADRVAEALRDA